MHCKISYTSMVLNFQNGVKASTMSSEMKKTVILCILDGWGIGEKNEGNPIYVANPQTIAYLQQNFPAGALKSSGISVGLPWGEEGNSEVGHLTLGAGRVLYQHYLRITESIKSGEFFKKPELLEVINHAKEHGGALHLVGLLTKGNVHASLEHLNALLKMATNENISEVYLHLFTDGRDSPPRSATNLLKKVAEMKKQHGVGTIASIAGRYYAMDRDNHWDRTEQAYNALLGDAPVRSIEETLKSAYGKNLSDEYIEPAIIIESHPIRDDDGIIFFNFREDRMRQITAPFLQPDFKNFKTVPIKNLGIATMTRYHDDQKTSAAFLLEKIPNTLGEILSKNGKTQLRTTETQKYAHVTYFFNGLHEKPFKNEYRIMIPSESLARPAERPEMRASAITERVLLSLQEGTYDFILVNYANPDIIAHTGNYRATIKAVTTTDRELGRLVRAVLNSNHVLMVTSDHGNAEVVLDLKTGETQTQHDANPVPFYLVGNEFTKSTQTPAIDTLENIGLLSDVAPTVLEIMGIPQPNEMTGSSLVKVL